MRWRDLILIYCALVVLFKGFTVAMAQQCTSRPSMTNCLFPGCPISAADGTTCTGVCNKNQWIMYESATTPTATCNAGNWTVTGACVQVCIGAPRADLLPAGLWPASCTDRTPVSSTCVGQCPNGYGTPTVACHGPGWSTDVKGRCSATPVCSSLPPGILNGRWPDNCLDTPEGQTCDIVCNQNDYYWYTAAGIPRATCLPGGTWSAPTPSACVQMKAAPCFSGDTKVIVQGAPGPVSMRELRTGQQVLCLDSGEDLLAPRAARWCEVMNWVHAEEVNSTQTRISFVRPDGRPGSSTVAPTHLIYTLTAAPLSGTATSVDALGPFQLMRAVDVRPGASIALSSDVAGSSFVITTVTAVEIVPAKGKYIPVIEHPYIVADGVVMPLWPQGNIDLIKAFINPVVPPDTYGVLNALPHYFIAPLFMSRLQPLGTPGWNGSWGGQPVWPGLILIGNLSPGGTIPAVTVNFTAVKEWFLPRYNAWKLDQNNAITFNELLRALRHLFFA